MMLCFTLRIYSPAVITFAISSFLLALIYRSWQLGQADTVTDDEADREVRERGARDEETMDDEITDEEMGVFPDYEAFCAAAG